LGRQPVNKSNVLQAIVIAMALFFRLALKKHTVASSARP
jgi:hypothetical protein